MPNSIRLRNPPIAVFRRRAPAFTGVASGPEKENQNKHCGTAPAPGVSPMAELRIQNQEKTETAHMKKARLESENGETGRIPAKNRERGNLAGRSTRFSPIKNINRFLTSLPVM
jgi:hypothetical protein